MTWANARVRFMGVFIALAAVLCACLSSAVPTGAMASRSYSYDPISASTTPVANIAVGAVAGRPSLAVSAGSNIALARFSLAAEDAGGLAQSFENPESLRGATAEEARSAIPEGYDGPFPLRKGVGERYFDPEAPGNAIYIEEGNPAASDPLHQGPYVRIANNGSVTRIPLQGNPTLP